MSIKKLLVLAAAGITSSAALAGTVAYTAKPTPVSMVNDNTGVYIEGMVGYNRYTYKDMYGTPDSSSWDNGTGNWAFGADIGYQFQRYLSAELGGIYTLKAKLNTPDNSTGKLQPWYAYLAGKLSIPVYDNISVFTKLGVGYQKVKVSNDGDTALFTDGSQSNWGPMFGAGVAYNFTPAIYVNAQWLRFTGKFQNQITAPNIFLAGVGYKFAM